MSRALEDVRVIDLTHVYQGPYCTMLLSYLGADVIKVEPPWGETLRGRGESENPIVFQMVNASKRDVSIDLKSEEGKEVLKDLVAESDILIENFKTGTMERLGLGYETLREVNDELIYAHSSGYGDTGPYKDRPAMDLTIQAASGIAHITGQPDSPPTTAGAAVSDMPSGAHLAIAVLAALHQREHTGEGQYIDVGMYDAMYPMILSGLNQWLEGSEDFQPRTGSRHSGLQISPYNIYPTKDGHVALTVQTQQMWETFKEIIDTDADLEDEKYDTVAERASRYEELDEIVTEWLADKERDEVVELLETNGIPVSPVQSLEEVVNDPQLEERNMLNWLPNQGAVGQEEIPVPGLPMELSESDDPEVTPSPEIGEHTDEVLTEVTGYSSDHIDDLTESGAVGPDESTE